MPQYFRLLIFMSIFTVPVVVCETDLTWKTNLIGQQCSRGCVSCSTVNGCLTCRTRYFLLLLRHGLRQTGVCVKDCPHGYYEVVTKNLKYCAKCVIENCHKCASLHECTKCQRPFVQVEGKCLKRCHNDKDVNCVKVVDCKVGNWSSWGACSKRGQLCGYKYGFRIRVRQIETHPSKEGKSCPATAEIQRCKMSQRVCSGGLPTNYSEYSNTFLKEQILRQHIRRKRRKSKYKDEQENKKSERKKLAKIKGEKKTNKILKSKNARKKHRKKALRLLRKMLRNANHYNVKFRHNKS